MSTAIATTPASYTKLVRAAARIDKLRKEIVPRFAKLKARIQAAEKELDETMLRLYRTALTAEINHVTSALYQVNEGQVFLNEVNEDEDFVAERLDAVAKLGQLVSAGSKALTEVFRQAKALENAVEKATAKAFERPDDEYRHLAWMDRNVEDGRKYILEAIRQVEALQAEAEDAVARADAKALAQVQAAVKASAIEGLVDANDTFVRFATEFIEKVEGLGIGHEAKAELIDGARDVLKEATESSRRAAPALQRAREIAAMAVETVDARKALKLLGLDAKHLARLSKALSVPHAELPRALETLIRELKLADASAKQWIVELRKAHLLPR